MSALALTSGRPTRCSSTRDKIQEEAIASEALQKAAESNSEDDFRYVFEKAFEGQVIERPLPAQPPRGCSSGTRLIAIAAAAVRVSTPSLAWMRSRCFFTVAGLAPRMSPMSRLILPLTTQ